jgi:hypothetical protein
MRIRRLRRKYLSVYGEYGNLGLFAVHKSSPNARKVFKRIWRIRGKNLCVHREDANRLLAYSPYTPRDIKECISPLIIIQIYIHLTAEYKLPILSLQRLKNHYLIHIQ